VPALTSNPVFARAGLAGLIEHYLLICKTARKAQGTRTLYSYRLGELAHFLGEGTPAHRLDELAVLHFLGSIQDRLAPSTFEGYYRSLKTFFNWLVREGVLKKHPMAGIPRPKVPKTVHRILSREQLKDVLAVLQGNSYLAVRNTAIFLVFLDTMVRLEELTNLKLDDVNFEEGLITVMGKGSKERRVVLGQEAQRALLAYRLRRYEPDPELWITEERRPMRLAAVKEVIKKAFHRAGVTGVKMGPHALRHTGAVNYLKNGGDLRTLQLLMGHARLNTTEIYLSDMDDAVKAAHAKASPVDNLFLKK
jgi:site-specific recombinase XerD